MICHLGATLAPVKDGDVIEETVDKTRLAFFKIAEAGWVKPSEQRLGATNVLADNNSLLVRLRAGRRTSRHEIVTSYPFCFNLAATDSGGAASPAGAVWDRGPGDRVRSISSRTRLGKPSLVRRPLPLYSGALSVDQTASGEITATATGFHADTAPPKAGEGIATAAAAPLTTLGVSARAPSRAMPKENGRVNVDARYLQHEIIFRSQLIVLGKSVELTLAVGL
ncbi:glycoside hydrolase family 61 protein [Xylariaceae sp. FL0662B]|nr:glycoside hydrolase family 61 protein [Xylariaceae sp. FL0662B]